MARNDPASLVAGAGLLTGIFTKLNAEVVALGGTEQDLHRLTTPAGNEIIRQMATLITTERAILNRPLEFLGFNLSYVPDTRLYNCLDRVGIKTVGDLVTKTAPQLEGSVPNFGKKSLELTREKLARHGLALRGEEPPAGSQPEPQPDLIVQLFDLLRLVNQKVDLTRQLADHRHMEERWKAEEASGSLGGELAGPEMRDSQRRSAEDCERQLSTISALIGEVETGLIERFASQ